MRHYAIRPLDDKVLGYSKHYLSLDGMRGVAAIAVVTYHADDLLAYMAPKSAYLAVDFFYVLSGFVLAHAYGDKLSHFSIFEFCQLRISRLYPLYIFGTLLTLGAVCGAASLISWEASKWSPNVLINSVPFALLMLPSPFTINLYPLNIPAWSLLYELIVNVVYAAKLLSGKVLIITIIIAGVAVAADAVLSGHIDQGTFWLSTLWGLGRVFYSFPVGVVLYRFCRNLSGISCIPSILPLSILVGAFYVNPSEYIRPIYDTLFITILSPMLVLLASRTRTKSNFTNGIFSFLGLISYPIYILQAPIISVLRNVLHRPYSFWWGSAYVLGMIILAWIAGVTDRAWHAYRRRRQVT